MSGHLSPDQIQEYSDAFQLQDKDKDGSLSASEFNTAVRSLGRVMTDAELKELGGGAGRFSQDEFLAAMAKAPAAAGAGGAGEFVAALQAFDKEKKGTMHSSELRGILTSLGDKFTDEECDRMFALAGVKFDQPVKYEDMVKKLLKAA